MSPLLSKTSAVVNIYCKLFLPGVSHRQLVVPHDLPSVVTARDTRLAATVLYGVHVRDHGVPGLGAAAVVSRVAAAGWRPRPLHQLLHITNSEGNHRTAGVTR